MSNLHVIQTSIEIVLIALVVIGIAYEPVLAKWEERQKGKVLKAFNKRKEYRK